MIRWFVRRVVKYILEELANSKDFEAILDRLSPGSSGNRYLDVKASVENGGTRSDSSLESDSMSKLVGAVVQRSESVKLSGNAVSEKVNEGRKPNQKVVDRLRNLGD